MPGKISVFLYFIKLTDVTTHEISCLTLNHIDSGAEKTQLMKCRKHNYHTMVGKSISRSVVIQHMKRQSVDRVMNKRAQRNESSVVWLSVERIGKWRLLSPFIH